MSPVITLTFILSIATLWSGTLTLLSCVYYDKTLWKGAIRSRTSLTLIPHTVTLWSVILTLQNHACHDRILNVSNHSCNTLILTLSTAVYYTDFSNQH